MSYLEALKTEATYTHTLNGAKTHSTTGNACLDFFAVAGGMRYRKPADQIALFELAYIQEPDLAMKLLFHLRDIRGGMGERRLFRTLLRHVARTWPHSAKKNAAHIAAFGRWDDLLCLLDTPAQQEAADVIRTQLERDLQALQRREQGEADAPISLLAKWLPSDNTSSVKTRALARRLIPLLGMNARQYRAALTGLRRHIALTERYLTNQRTDKIRYSAVPARAMFKYRQAFMRQDTHRFAHYLAKVQSGKECMHADTLFPYEILRPFFKDDRWRRSVKGEQTLEALWNSLSTVPGNRNALSVVDTSASMYWPDDPKPALMAQAMGLYCAERCTGLFHNVFLTFESRPHLVEIHGKTLADKLRCIQQAPWGGSTRLEAVFDLILRTAVSSGAKQEDMPDVLYIFSDMEFNAAVRDPGKTVYENARERFLEAGYQLPAVVFHNVNSWQMQTPVRSGTRGAALTSGASVSTLKERFDGNVTPLEHMLRVLGSPRYQAIRA